MYKGLVLFYALMLAASGCCVGAPRATAFKPAPFSLVQLKQYGNRSSAEFKNKTFKLYQFDKKAFSPQTRALLCTAAAAACAGITYKAGFSWRVLMYITIIISLEALLSGNRRLHYIPLSFKFGVDVDGQVNVQSILGTISALVSAGFALGAIDRYIDSNSGKKLILSLNDEGISFYEWAHKNDRQPKSRTHITWSQLKEVSALLAAHKGKRSAVESIKLVTADALQTTTIDYKTPISIMPAELLKIIAYYSSQSESKARFTKVESDKIDQVPAITPCTP